MSRIDELLTNLAPGGIVYSTIGEIADCVSGATPASGVLTYWTDGTIPWMSSGEVSKGTVFDTNKRITQDAYDSCSTKMVPPNAVVIALAGQGKTRGTVARTRISLCTNQSLCSIIVHVESLDSDFLYHFLRTQYQQLRTMSSGEGSRGGLNLQMIRNYRIPVPPLEVQREIVSILDTFTQLEAELEAELEARRQQYEHYRDSLLSYDGDSSVRWTTLGDASVRVSSGGTPLAREPKYYESGTIPWLRTQEVRFGDVWGTQMRITETAVKETSAKWIPENCVIVAISGATAGRSAINKIRLTTNQHCCNFQVDPEQAHYRFVFHWVSSRYEAIKAMGQGARSDLNAGLIKAFEIALPPLDEQERIASLLDNFDTLVNDLSFGLPAEITARRQQYEYYRDQLLTFNELTTV